MIYIATSFINEYFTRFSLKKKISLSPTQARATFHNFSEQWKNTDSIALPVWLLIFALLGRLICFRRAGTTHGAR